jgi:hypothetical protein
MPPFPAMQPTAQTAPTAPTISSGFVTATPLKTAQAQAKLRKQTDEEQAQPYISALAAQIMHHYEQARTTKMLILPRLEQAMRQRRGEYDPDKLTAIRQQGGSEVYMQISGVKCRAAKGWLEDLYLTSGSDRPWVITPTPVPDLPPEEVEEIVAKLVGPIKQDIMAGNPPSQDQIEDVMEALYDQRMNEIKEEAADAADRMADKMEDQLDEGGFRKAFSSFLDDLTTFPAAILKGPVIYNKPKLTWVKGNPVPQIKDELQLAWEHVNPFDVYPSPTATTVNDGYLLQRHRMSRQTLVDLKGVDGYSEGAINEVLSLWGTDGLQQWMIEDGTRQAVEDKRYMFNPEGLISAMQYWGSALGQTLLDWGMDKKDIDDPLKEYHIEAWLIGHVVIKAILNPDPLRRKPYYKASYEEIPGNWWGRSVCDLVRDCQNIVNAASRSIVNNASIASGPQVVVDVSRLPAGEEVSMITPWKIWQVTNDPMAGSTTVGGARPIDFFQPQTNLQELLAIHQKFSDLADEYTGIPKYLTGQASGGAGRTASGLSMLINNASKVLKQVVGNIDINVMQPLLEKLYLYNMMYSDDPELKGDVQIIARGATALVAKENAQVRRNEFLAATANPIDMQIVGINGRREILREVAKTLDMNPDKIVPPEGLVQQMAAQAQTQAAGSQPSVPGQPPQPTAPGGTPGSTQINQQQLSNGAPVTDNFSPTS